MILDDTNEKRLEFLQSLTSVMMFLFIYTSLWDRVQCVFLYIQPPNTFNWLSHKSEGSMVYLW